MRRHETGQPGSEEMFGVGVEVGGGRKKAERWKEREKNTLNWGQRQMEESVEVSTTALLA